MTLRDKSILGAFFSAAMQIGEITTLLKSYTGQSWDVSIGYESDCQKSPDFFVSCNGEWIYNIRHNNHDPSEAPRTLAKKLFKLYLLLLEYQTTFDPNDETLMSAFDYKGETQ